MITLHFNKRNVGNSGEQCHRHLQYLCRYSYIIAIAARRKAEEERLKKPFQHVYITCPDGQHVQYLNDDCYQSRENKGGVVVRQSYPIKPLGPARGKPASQETCRTLMTDGTVIKVS